MSTPLNILVTGGNRGIGLETCRQLAALGHTVLLGSRDHAKGQAAAATLSGNVQAVQLDMDDSASIAALAADLAARFGHLDVLINNAAVISTIPAATVAEAEMKRVFQTNFHGPHALITALLPLLRRSPQGRIINLSSGMGALEDLTGGYAAYRLSKTALNALTILLANELRNEGVLVHAMCPGWVKTDMGGAGAQREVSQGADTAVWLATAPDTGSGKFWRDRKVIKW
jgi:NAD(P)-dependent dehydrogenase (short-subunit alcohol dehydrogenase family)